MWHTSNIPFCKFDHVDSVIFTEFSSAAYQAKWLIFSKLVTYHSLFSMFFTTIMIMVKLYHWNLCFSLGIYLFIIQELKVVLQVLSVIYSPFFVTEQHSIGIRCQFGDFKSSVKTYPQTYVLSML